MGLDQYIPMDWRLPDHIDTYGLSMSLVSYFEWQVFRLEYLLNPSSDKKRRLNDLKGIRKKYWARAEENYYERMRKTNSRRAMPGWVGFEEKAKIKQAYDEARHLSEVMGTQYEVDHIYPINSDWVCGLHTIKNLHVCTSEYNNWKSNKRIRLHDLLETEHKTKIRMPAGAH